MPTKFPEGSGEAVKNENARLLEADALLSSYPPSRDQLKDDLGILTKAAPKKRDIMLLPAIASMLLMKVRKALCFGRLRVHQPALDSYLDHILLV